MLLGLATFALLVNVVYGDWEPQCDLEGLKDCDYPADDVCGNMGCVIVKLEGCDEITKDKATNSEFHDLYELWLRMCVVIGPCDVTGAKECGNTEPGANTREICRSMECSIGRLEGCDQETLDSVTEEPGTTLQDLREKQYRTCGPCSMAVLEDCQQTGQDRDTICSNMLCMVDALYGCDEDVQNTLLQKIGSQSMDNVNNLIEVLDC